MAMLMLKVLLQILAVLAALLTATLDYVTSDKRTRRFKHIRFMLYGIVGLILIAGIAVTIGDDITRRHEIATLTSELTSIRTTIGRTSDVVTGGNSFPYLNIVQGRVLLINGGHDSLYDIGVRMWAPSDYANVTNSDQFRALEKRALNLTLSSMAPGSAREVARIELIPTPLKSFEVTIIARNGSFTQQILLGYIGQGWHTAYRVFRGPVKLESAKLLERVDPMFPRDSDGAIEWDADK
jgi:hypothetical protein